MYGRGRFVDRATQGWVKATGRRVSFDDHPWLYGPVGGPLLIADEWVARQALFLGGTVTEGGGLLDRVSDLAGYGFDPSTLSSSVVNFYERTSEWRLEVWSQWRPLAWPIAWLLSSVFAQRLHQFSLPLRAMEAAYGMDSRIVTVRSSRGIQLGAAWLRTLRATGQTVYSGWYGTAILPDSDRPSLRVVFPLPNGNLTVFLRPDTRDDGALVLSSPIGPFGTEGAYLIVANPNESSGWVRRVPLAERFVVGLDDEGTLRTQHALNLWRLPVIQFVYRLERPEIMRQHFED
jgi:hypothetical protein